MATMEPLSVEELRKLEAFQELTEEVLQGFLAGGAIRTLSPRTRLSTLAREYGEKYFFLLRGVLAITLDSKAQAQLADVKGSKRPPKDRQYLGYFDAGACLSNGFLSGYGATTPSRLDCIAVNAVTLLELQREHLEALFRRQPQWHARVAESLGRTRRAFLAHQAPSRRLVQDFFLRENYVTSSVVRVGRLDRCLDCNKCYDACAERHGAARMARFGPTLGRLTFPVVCRTCIDHPCVAVCKLGSIAFDDASGDIHISDTCKGCGLCAKHCPNDAISMVPLATAEIGTKGPRKRAVKCDHCAGYADRACLSACPTGALIELTPDDLFRELEPDPVSLVRSFSDVPFMNGKPMATESQRRWERLTTWCGWLTVLVILGLGVESFLIRTQPEYSFLYRLIRGLGKSFPVTFTSGRGIGHWFGYVGTGAMVASVLYSLRTRVNRCKGWGSQRSWLSAHLWLGFVGAALVTYHAAFKLDRWASIALYLVWLVIVTGAMGRYVFGWVHSTVNLAEFELDAIRGKCQSFADGCRTPRAVQSLIGNDSREGRKRFTLFVMLWEELRDRVALLWLFAFGTKHLVSAIERREMVQVFAEWAVQRRRSSYGQSAAPILRHWNIVHIVLAVAMFILAAFHVVYGFLYKAV